MPRWTDDEYKDYLTRRTPREPLKAGGVDKESELHRDILNEVKRRGWIAFHGSMAHRTFRCPGEPDFLILGDGGRFFMVECKTKTGKVSVEQNAIMAWAKKLNHQIHVVRSFDEFLAIIPTNVVRVDL